MQAAKLEMVLGQQEGMPQYELPHLEPKLSTKQ